MPPAGDGWLHELKHDGFRIITYKDGERVWLWSRNGRDWSAEFVAITAAVRALPFRRIMIDGEAVTHCVEGLPHFHKLLSGRPGDGLLLRLWDPVAPNAEPARGSRLKQWCG